MSRNNPQSASVLERVHEAREHLAVLIPKLHEANEQCAESSKPLAKLAELNSEQRKKLAKDLRDANQRWEQVVSLVDQTIASLDSICSLH